MAGEPLHMLSSLERRSPRWDTDPETARFFEQVSGKVIEHTEAEEADAQSQHHEYNLLNADAVRRL